MSSLKLTLMALVALTMQGFCADEPAEKPDSHLASTKRAISDALPKLVDLSATENRKYIKAEPDKPLLPHRLYKRYEPKINGWVFDVTNAKGKFSVDPPMAMAAESTIPGSWAGGKDDVWYYLKKEEGATLKAWIQIPNPGQSGEYHMICLGEKEEEYTYYHSIPEGKQSRR